MKKLFTILLALMITFMFTGCEKNDGKFLVGICQLATHDALDAATKGFKDALIAELGEENIIFEEGNAAGDITTCVQICNGFVNDSCDLILANATAALQAASSATTTIPVLGTSITAYDVALNLTNFTGTIGNNVSGTSDLAPLDQQAAMFKQFLPDCHTIGILYCSSEPNSIFQASEVKKFLEADGFEVVIKTFTDSNDVNIVCSQLCDLVDAIYLPTDNTVANCASAINDIAIAAKKPIIAGEESICQKCGVLTLSIDYYNLGITTGKMAAKILRGESNINEMPIEYFANPVKKYNPELCNLYNIVVPEEFVSCK